MVGYATFYGDYHIWYPGSCRLKKARDVVFHEEAVEVPAPVLYGDEVSPLAPEALPPSLSPITAAKIAAPDNTRLTIRIPPRPRPVGGSTSEGSRLVASVPDFPKGTTRSGMTREEPHINMVLADEEIRGALGGMFLATSKDPTIAEAFEYAR
jgi:hypothetical protein